MVEVPIIDRLILESLDQDVIRSVEEIKRYVRFRAHLNAHDNSYHPGTKVPRWEFICGQRIDILLSEKMIHHLCAYFLGLTKEGKERLELEIKHENENRKIESRYSK